MVDLGLTITEDPNHMVAAAFRSLDSSGDTIRRYLDTLAGTSFDKRIISEQGVQYADNEIERARAVRSALLQHRREIDDTLLALNSYIAACSRRRREGIERIKNTRPPEEEWPSFEEDDDG